MTQLQAGDMAPDFKSTTQDGAALTLADLKGQRTILYFYPKDNTSGCTLEAKSLRDGRAELARMGFRIIGVSPDSEKSHRNSPRSTPQITTGKSWTLTNRTAPTDDRHEILCGHTTCGRQPLGHLAASGTRAAGSTRA